MTESMAPPVVIKRPSLLDFTLHVTAHHHHYGLQLGSAPTSPSTTNIVNWLNQTADYTTISKSSSTPNEMLMSDNSLSSPTSMSSSTGSSASCSGHSSDDEDPFNYLYLLASAAVSRLNDQMSTSPPPTSSVSSVPSNIEQFAIQT